MDACLYWNEVTEDQVVTADVSVTWNVNVNVNVYSLISPWFQYPSQLTPLVLELSLIVSSPLSRIQRIFCSLCHSQFSNFRSTRYPSLLGGRRQYRMRSLPKTSTHDQQWELNPRPSDLVQRPIHLATGFQCCCHVFKTQSGQTWGVSSSSA